MDFFSFCQCLYRLLSSRIPSGSLQRLYASDRKSLNGLYVPLAEGRSYHFDIRKAYDLYCRQSLSPEKLADHMEWDFLGQLLRGTAFFPTPSSFREAQDGLCLRLLPFPSPFLKKPQLARREEWYLQPFYLGEGWHPLFSRPIDSSDLGRWQITEEELWIACFEQAPVNSPPVLMSFSLFSPGAPFVLRWPGSVNPSSWTGEESAFILTNAAHYFGASVVFYPNLLLSLHRFLQDFFLLFFSPHEVILVPARSFLSFSELKTRLLCKTPWLFSDEQDFPAAIYLYTVEHGLKKC